MFPKSKTKKQRIAFLLGYILVACLVVLITKPLYIYSILIVLVPPALVNFYWLEKSRKKVFVFSITATFLFALAAELSSRLADSWDVQSVLPRLFGLLPLENIIFAFLNFFFILAFYEYFVDKDTTKKISKKFKYLVILFSLFSLVIFSLYFYNPEIVSMNYATLALITLLIPSIIIFSKNTHLIKKSLLPVLFFAIVFFIYEIVSLKIGSWWWPGEYLFPIQLFGKTFPLDDVIIWYFLSTFALIGGYEFFADDFK